MKKESKMATMSGTLDAEQRMTSLDIAQVTGKPHNDVLKAIRKMEAAWEKVHQGKFSQMQIRMELPNGGYRLVPAFSLTKTESLYIATKFNDEARAKLVKRWYELECRQLGVTIPEQRLLVTEREIMQKGDEIRRGLIAGENADADGCYTVSQLAEMMQMTVKELNKRLVAEGVQFWNGGRYKLTKEYEGSGYAQDRAFHYYALDGEKKERKYLVWTPTGMEFIRTTV
ncbi:MAG: phage regulatory protein/antirepressor Ant [Prevotella sp.]|nr:phage regulatory protein/antirepressor Ant [Prevotella sp.]